MSHVKSVRQSELVWRFETTSDCPLWETCEAYTTADKLMLAEGYIPGYTRFKTNDDGTFHLWQTYVADPAQAI